MATSTAGQTKSKATYGWLYERLAFTKGSVDHGPILRLLREHILENTSVPPGKLLLGEPVAERRRHSIYSLSLATGLDRRRLRKVLVRKGLVPAGCEDVADNLVVVPAAEAERLCMDLRDAVPLLLLSGSLGCSRMQATSLYDEGVIVPLVDRSPEDQLGHVLFATSTIERLLDEVAASAPLASEPPEGAVDLTRACKSIGLSTAEVMRTVLAGRAPSACRVAGGRGLATLRVIPSEVRAPA